MMLELSGFVAVILMVTMYALEARSPWFVFGFAIACALASLYATLIQSWPFAAVEGLWSLVAFRRWWNVRT